MLEEDLKTSARGLRLRLSRWGPSDGEPVLVLHGFLEQGAAWQRFAHHLGMPVIAPDHRGHGCSEHIGAGGFYHFWDYVGDVDAVVRHIGEPVHLVGHSMGGTIATLFAGARPDAVRTLTLIEGLGPPDMTETAQHRVTAFLDTLAEPKRHPVFANVAEAAARLQRGAPSIPDHEALRLAGRMSRPVIAHDPQARTPGEGKITWRWDALHRSRAPVPFQESLHLRWLAAITCPTLLITGGRSPYAQLGVSARREALRDAVETTFPDAGHLIHHDDPEGLASRVRTHIEA